MKRLILMEETTITNAAPVTPEQPAHTPTDAAKSGSPKREYTQAELDDLFQERVKRAETSTMNRVLKLLGVTSEADIPTLKTTIEKARDLEKSAMTDTQRLEKERDDAKREKEEATAQLTAERAERRNDRIASHLLAEASKLKATDAETVLLYARDKHKAELDAIMGEDGTLDEGKTKKLLETIKTAKPVYFQAVIQGAGVPSNAGGRAALDLGAEALKRASAMNQRIIRGR
jgi:hypothetical protein